MVAEPPAYQARKITAYTRGRRPGVAPTSLHPGRLRHRLRARRFLQRARRSAEPLAQSGGRQRRRLDRAARWRRRARSAKATRPPISPKGDKVVFVRRGQLWWAPLDGTGAASQMFKARGTNGHPSWSPDGARLAFTSARGDHALIGVFEAGSATLRYIDPSTDFDSEPEWSPDSRSVAFLRVPSSGLRMPREPHRTGEPWSIRVASAETGVGREVFRAREGAGSVFRGVNARNQILWADGGRLVFPWEADGWTHLYSVAADGGKATLLTPGAFEVEDAALAAGKRRDRLLFQPGRYRPAPSVEGPGRGRRARRAHLRARHRVRPVAHHRPQRDRLSADPTRSVRCTPRSGSAPSVRDLDPSAIPADFPGDAGDATAGDLPRRRRARHPRPALPAREEARRRTFARDGLLSRRIAAPDAARLALHVLLRECLCDESVSGEPGIRGAQRELPQRHRLRDGVSRGAELWRERRHGV